MHLTATLISLLPLAAALPAVKPLSSAGTLLLIPTQSNTALPTNPVAIAVGCLDAAGNVLKGATTQAAGCGSYQSTGQQMRSQKGFLQLVQQHPYPLAAVAGSAGDGFGLWSFPADPGYVFYGDFQTQWHTGGQSNGNEVHLNTVAGDSLVSLYFNQ